MNIVQRITTFLWPYKRRLCLSVLCAFVISLLWSFNIAVAFPIIKVLFEGDNLHTYVENDIVDLKTKIDGYSTQLQRLKPVQLEERARLQRKLNEASHALLNKERIRTSILPWVPRDRFQTVLLILSIVISATLLKGGLIYLQELLVGDVVYSCSNDLRSEAFNRVMELDYQTAQAVGSSHLTSRLTHDVSEFSVGLRLIGSRVVREPLKAICCLAVALWFNWRLTLLSIVIVPAVGALFYYSGKKMRSAARHAMETMGNIYHSVSEALDSPRVVIAFSGEEHHRRQLEQTNKDYFNNSMRLVRISAMIRPVTEFLGIVAFTLVLIPGAYLVLNNSNQLGGIKLANGPLGIADLATLYGLLVGTLDPIRKLSGVFPQLKKSIAAADRIFAIADMQSVVPETDAPVVFKPHNKRITFEDISFRYQNESTARTEELPLTLNSVSLDIPYGEVVAIVGGNGSGKSTLLSLLPRLLDPSDGTVRIDGVDIRDLALADLRSQIGVVSQETALFDETIEDNIRYGKPDATPAMIEEYARKAHAWDFIQELPEGMNKRVGVGGRKLSGGQRQRIALARAMIRDPKILILDEATSAIDAESEDLIHKALREFCQDRTVFMITHVLSQTFVDLVDRIIVMEQGEIVAMGTHDQLYSCCEIYKRLLLSGAQPSRAA